MGALAYESGNFFNDGVKGVCFLLTGKAERSKGSAPSSRLVASKPKRRGGDPIALVRLRKLGLLIGHDMLNSHPDAEVSDKIFRKYTSLVNSDIIAHKAKGKITLEDALQAVHAGIAAHEARIASDGHKKWRSLFSGQFGVDGWRAASTVQSFMSRQIARVSMQSRCHRNGQKFGDLKIPVTMKITTQNAGNSMRRRHRWTSPRVLSRGAGCRRTMISDRSRRKQREEQVSTDGQRSSCVCYADLRPF